MRFAGNKNKIRTIKSEINTQNVSSMFGKKTCTVINKWISKNNLSNRWDIISTTEDQKNTVAQSKLKAKI